MPTPEHSGEFYVFDGRDPRVTGEDTRMLGAFPGYRPHPESIVVAFASRPGFPHPVLDRWASPLGSRRAAAEFRASAPGNNRGIVLLEVPTTIENVRREKIFDLRRPASQQWLNRMSRDRMLLACFLYTKPFEGIPIIEERPIPVHQGLYNFEYLPPSGKYRAGAPIPPDAVASFALRTGPGDGGNFTDLLPLLMSPGRGGSPVTEAIGTMLRMAGSRGLIYPSARNDVYCVFDQENIVHHHGWCFVDYSAFEFARCTARGVARHSSICTSVLRKIAMRVPGNSSVPQSSLNKNIVRRSRGGIRCRTEKPKSGGGALCVGLLRESRIGFRPCRFRNRETEFDFAFRTEKPPMNFHISRRRFLQTTSPPSRSRRSARTRSTLPASPGVSG